MKENQKKAFDFAADVTKQLITLSTAIITLSVTFSKDIVGTTQNSPKWLLIWTWGVFIASIFFGILTLSALTGSLNPLKKKEEKEQSQEMAASNPQKEESDDITPYKKNVRVLSGLQFFLFFSALVMIAVYGYRSLSESNVKDANKGKYMIVRESKLGSDTTKYLDTLYLDK